MPNVAIIKYNAGNIQSVIFALNRLGCQPIVSDHPEAIQHADKVIFPGVGEASSAMQYLHERGLDDVICSLTQPVLGICLGLQLLCRHTEENDTRCLNIFDIEVKRIPNKARANGPSIKVPHVGWNVLIGPDNPLWADLPGEPFVYFVHSFAAEISSQTIAKCQYGIEFSAALQHRNFFAVQFHPEKSGQIGARILANFLKM